MVIIGQEDADDKRGASRLSDGRQEPLGISQSAFAIRLGVSFPRVNEVIRGQRAVTPDTALRLAQVTGMSADFWLGLQLDWDLWHALRSRDAVQIAKQTPLPAAG